MAPSLSPHPFSAGSHSEAQNDVPSLTDRNGIITAVYLLYAIGFFFHITALIGFIVAYVYGQGETGRNKLHFEFQKGIFKIGLVFVILISLTCLVSLVAFGISVDDIENLSASLTMLGTGLLIALLSLYWFIWTIIAIIFGFKALGNNEAPTTDKILGISPLPKRYRTPSLAS